MEKKFYELMMLQQQKEEVVRVLACNEESQQFGVMLTQEDANRLMVCRHDALMRRQRVEFGEGVLPKLITAFCGSQYINQVDYADILERLQDTFYLYKNESGDNLIDDELIAFMKEQFEGVCHGSLEYLENTCLERFARAVRAGYRGFTDSGCVGEYEQFSEEGNWDRTLFLEILEELIV